MPQNLSDFYKEVAEQTDSTPTQVEAVVLEFFYALRNEISKSQGNNILVHKLGNFHIPKNSIDKYLETIKKSYEMGNMSEKRYEKGANNLNRLKALIEEKNPDES